MSGISLTGMISGLDTSSMVDALMKIERQPYDNLNDKKTSLTNEQSIVRSLNTKLLTLKNAVADLMYSSSFNLTSAKASDNSVINVTSTDSAATGSYDVTVNQLAKKHVVKSSEFDADVAPTLSGSFKLYGNGLSEPKTITLSGTTNQEMLENLRDSINAAKAGVTASIIETSPGNLTLTLTADKYGEDYDIQYAEMASGPYPTDNHVYFGGDASLLNGLGIKKSSDASVNDLNTAQAAQDAKVKVNGIDIVSSSNDLSGVVPGLSISLLKEGASSSITVSKDVDKIAAKIQTFVDAYNDAITLVRTNTAKDGAMQGDSTLLGIESELSDLVNGIVSGAGAYKFLFDIGLEVDKGVTKGSEMTGKLSFDKAAFVEAFNKDPDAVYQLFAKDGETASEQGVAVRFYNSINNYTRTGTGYLTYKISGYDSEISMITQQMEDMDLRLQSRQAQLEKQFSDMETALSSLKNQQSWLTSQISSLG